VADGVTGENVFVDEVEANAIVEVVAGKNGMHTDEFFGFADIDFFDARLGVRAAQNLTVQHAGEFEIGGIEGLAGQFFDDIDAFNVFTDVFQVFFRGIIKHV